MKLTVEAKPEPPQPEPPLVTTRWDTHKDRLSIVRDGGGYTPSYLRGVTAYMAALANPRSLSRAARYIDKPAPRLRYPWSEL